MGCMQYRENLEILASGDSDEARFVDTKLHLAGCLTCRKTFKHIKKIDSLIKKKISAVNTPSNLKEYIMSRIKLKINVASYKKKPVGIIPVIIDGDKEYLPDSEIIEPPD